MAAPKIYDQVYLYLDGSLQAQNISVETSLESDDQDAETIPLGWAGITPSPDKRMVSATFLVPIDGFEFDYEGKKLRREKVTLAMQLGGSGKKCTSVGFFKNVKISGGVGKTMEVSIEFTGTPSEFEG